jgi:hypothetical protein
MTDENSTVDPRLAAQDTGSVGSGCLIGFLIQVLFLVLPLGLSTLGKRYQEYALGTAAMAGITQWVVLGPVIWRQRAKRKTVKGIVIAGSIGFLLSSACGVLYLGNF